MNTELKQAHRLLLNEDSIQSRLKVDLKELLKLAQISIDAVEHRDWREIAPKLDSLQRLQKVCKLNQMRSRAELLVDYLNNYELPEELWEEKQLFCIHDCTSYKRISIGNPSITIWDSESEVYEEALTKDYLLKELKRKLKEKTGANKRPGHRTKMIIKYYG